MGTHAQDKVVAVFEGEAAAIIKVALGAMGYSDAQADARLSAFLTEREAAAATPSLPDGQPCYRWEPVKNDCRRHHGPHEGFRCNGAMGRLIEVYHGTAAATPSLDVDTLRKDLKAEFIHNGSYNRTAVWMGIDRVLARLSQQEGEKPCDVCGSTSSDHDGVAHDRARLDEGSATPDQGKGEPR